MKDLNALALRRLQKVVLTPAHDKQTPVKPEVLAAAVGNLFSYGYALNREAFAAALTAPQGQIVDLVKAVKALKGTAPVKPMYPNFPRQVAEASQLELYQNAIMHYAGDALGVRIMPVYVEEAREALTEEVEVTLLGLADENALREAARLLVEQSQPYSEQDREDLFLLKDYVVAAPVKVKENLAYLASTFREVDWSSSFKGATDVLRLAVAFSDGDVSLAERTRFHLTRGERRIVLKALDAVFTANGGDPRDLTRHEEAWKRLAKTLHHREFSYAAASKALSSLQAGEVRSFESELEALLREGNIAKVTALLEERPGVFARRLSEVLRKGSRRDTASVVSAFEKVAAQVSAPVLVQLWGYFNGPEAATLPRRVVQVKGKRQRTLTIENRLPEGDWRELVEIIEDALRSKYTGKKVFFREEGTTAAEVAVPLGVRNASAGLMTVGRGSRVKIPQGEKNTLRLFCHWHDMKGGEYPYRVDLDLSGFFVDETFSTTETISYYRLRSSTLSAVHSGDITSAPNGAAEYIDIPMKAALKAGYRYVVPSILSFSGQTFDQVPDASAGFMVREHAERGEVFDASTVAHRYDLTSASRSSIPFVVDLKTRELIWLDSSVRVQASGANVANSSNAFLTMLESAVKTHPMTVEKLASLTAEVVESEEEADLVIDPRQVSEVLQLLPL